MADAAPPRDWLAKSLAGLVLGAGIALGASAVFARSASGIPMPIRVQLAMWMSAPIWLVVLSSVFFFGSGRRAWLWLGAANVVLAGVYLVLPRA